MRRLRLQNWREDGASRARYPTPARHRPFRTITRRLLAGIRSDTLFRMYNFHRSDEFDAWLAALKDKVGRARIAHRIRSAEHGNFGDCEPVGEGVSEMRIHFGPGYRLYFTRRGEAVFLLLLGGAKSSQKRDIKRALEMARTLDKE